MRDYDPGTYLQSDPTGLDRGLAYLYAHADPLLYIDPFRLRTEITIWHPVGWGGSSFGHVSTDAKLFCQKILT